MNIEKKENLPIEPTMIEIIESCRDILGEELCNDLAELDDLGDVISLMYTALIEKGIDPIEFLKFVDTIEDMRN